MNNMAAQSLKNASSADGKCNEEISRKPSLHMQNLVRGQVFMKSIDSYIYPAELGLKHFWCMDCGDKFLFKSSYDFHTNRASLNISFFCRVCKVCIIFKNRCKVLSHIRLHVHQMTTLNLADIQVQPLTEHSTYNDNYEDDSIIPSLSNYLLILNKNNNLPADTAAQDTISKVDSLIEQLNVSFDQASQHLEHIFNEPPEIIENIITEDDTSANLMNGNCTPTRTIIQEISFQKDNTLSLSENTDDVHSKSQDKNSFMCRYCKTTFRSKHSFMFTDRLNHFQGREMKSTCDVCLLVMPNICALLAHKSIHSNTSTPPYTCPECGNESQTTTGFHMHLSYGCFHFARCMIICCFVPNCRNIVKHKFLKDHYIKIHTKLVYKCSLCPVACFTSNAIQLHIQLIHDNTITIGDTFYQCLPCSHKLISQSNISKHFDSHMKNYTNHQNVYSCPGCSVTYQLLSFFKKHIAKCSSYQRTIYRTKLSSDFFFDNVSASQDKLTHYNTKSICLMCKKTFLCAVNTIDGKPGSLECPFCKISTNTGDTTSHKPESLIQTREINEDIQDNCMVNVLSSEECISPPSSGKKYYKMVVARKKSPSSKISNKKIQEMKIVINDAIKKTKKNERQADLTASKSRKRRKLLKRKNTEEISEFSAGVMIPERSDGNNLNCAHCSLQSSDKVQFREHIISHRDNSSTYQCMECGLCFVVESSLSSHLLITHGIVDTGNYIQENECFNEVVQELDNSSLINPERNVNENQCHICLEQFDNSIDHDKHFRVHGMAFILKKQRTKVNDSAPICVGDV